MLAEPSDEAAERRRRTVVKGYDRRRIGT